MHPDTYKRSACDHALLKLQLSPLCTARVEAARGRDHAAPVGIRPLERVSCRSCRQPRGLTAHSCGPQDGHVTGRRVVAAPDEDWRIVTAAAGFGKLQVCIEDVGRRIVEVLVGGSIRVLRGLPTTGGSSHTSLACLVQKKE